MGGLMSEPRQERGESNAGHWYEGRVRTSALLQQPMGSAGSG